MRIELFQASRSGDRTKILIIEHTGDTVRQEWGLEGGAMQKSERICTAVNVGKKNERDAEAQAKFEARSKIKKKIREGYLIRGGATKREPPTSTSSKHGATINLDDLPEAFAPSKPIQTVPKDFLLNGKVNPESNYCGERKNNGVNLWLLVDSKGDCHFYSRSAREITHIVGKVRVLVDFARNIASRVPRSTFVSFEFIGYDATGKERPEQLRGIVNDRTSAAKAEIRYLDMLTEGYTFGTKVFDLLFWNNRDITQNAYWIRRLLMTNHIWTHYPEYKSDFFPVVTQAIVDKAREDKLEGLILRSLWGPDSYIEFTLTGKPARAGAYKCVFNRHAEFFILDAEIGKAGRLQGLPARFHFGQFDENGGIVECGFGGPGKLKTDDLPGFAELLGLDLGKVELGKVYETNHIAVDLKFRSQKMESNALEHPVILEIRDDKPARECLFGDWTEAPLA